MENAAHNCSFAVVTSLPAHRIWCLHGIYGIHKIIIKLTLHRIEAIKLLSIVHAIQKFISRLSLHTYNAWLMEYQWAHHGYGLKCATASNSNSQLLLLPRLLLSLHSELKKGRNFGLGEITRRTFHDRSPGQSRLRDYVSIHLFLRDFRTWSLIDPALEEYSPLESFTPTK